MSQKSWSHLLWNPALWQLAALTVPWAMIPFGAYLFLGWNWGVVTPPSGNVEKLFNPVVGSAVLAALLICLVGYVVAQTRFLYAVKAARRQAGVTAWPPAAVAATVLSW